MYINDLLSSGEVADLYMPEDKDGNSKGSWEPKLGTIFASDINLRNPLE